LSINISGTGVEILLIAIDKTRDVWVKTGCDIYQERLKRYARFRFECITPTRQLLEPAVQMKKEAEALEKLIKQGDTVILLDENGKEYNSPGLARFISDDLVNNRGRLVFIIGGPFGFDPHSLRTNRKFR
jgi:23S rRNA (pseudouridine1915-N3)-methyltransferase